ncbi:MULTISPECIES: ABC transporter substrate-binding protein [unclassified Lentimonas]|uniref:ABC transporter substrate-binding protein n=1 Tax=unclassified Lentimonas TaxID=2630993 RepID=UPI00132A8835|nr:MULTISPECIES: ABC transporter substrate-binding protein [unclassified Lentimonas]CAA6679961.1 Unannotated [Lentimonas sp. CC4]CAA6686517.1 Unannotated [Lentimonas sp. CC6]CAA7074793.1 Unannotated [Lentimonas sp. CC4]CAA7169420.1 Unannotated [Lentimonas sp. CC21]CAA7180189.1 Unannotated [Lentimonas sp. CC8]
MRRIRNQFIATVLCVAVLLLGVGCESESVPEGQVLKVGVIASLSGEGQRGGIVTVNCASVIADYYNEHGGLEVDGERYRIELLVRDDVSDASRALEIAYDFVQAGDVHYVIGPEGNAVSEAVAPVLDSAGILYLHYGLSNRLLSSSSYGVLAKPRAIQLFASVVDYLKENQGDLGELSVCVLVGASRPAMYQKLKVEEMVEQAGIEVVRFARFDVTEAVFDLSHPPVAVQSFVARVVSSQSNVVILCGQPHGTLSLAVSSLREGGYTGLVIARDLQQLNDARESRLMAGEVWLVGCSAPIEERSDYYLNLKDRYLDTFSEWDADVDLKLYALESVLRGVVHCGSEAVSSSEMLIESIETLNFPDPFIVEMRMMGLQGGTLLTGGRQLSIPILLSKYSGGEMEVVYRSDSSSR